MIPAHYGTGAAQLDIERAERHRRLAVLLAQQGDAESMRYYVERWAECIKRVREFRGY